MGFDGLTPHLTDKHVLAGMQSDDLVFDGGARIEDPIQDADPLYPHDAIDIDYIEALGHMAAERGNLELSRRLASTFKRLRGA